MQYKNGTFTMLDDYNKFHKNKYTAGTSGSSGLTGFKNWECYMLVKFGNANNFNFAGDYQYLLNLPLYPDQVSEQITTNWNQQKVLGRSSALSAYANTELKTVSFSLDLHRDFLTGSFSHTKETLFGAGGSLNRQAAGLQVQDEGGPFGTRTWYVNANKMLQISCYPQYTSQGLIPPTTYFVFGQMILKGYVTSYSTEWKKPILNTFYGWNSVTITMQCYPDTIISASDIITNKKSGTASTQNTYNTNFPDTSALKSDVMVRNDEYGGTTNRTNSRVDSSLGGSVRDT